MTPRECHWTRPVKPANDAGQARIGRQLRRRWDPAPNLLSTPPGKQSPRPVNYKTVPSSRATHKPRGTAHRVAAVVLTGQSFPVFRGSVVCFPLDPTALLGQTPARESARFLRPDSVSLAKETRLIPRVPTLCAVRQILGLILMAGPYQSPGGTGPTSLPGEWHPVGRPRTAGTSHIHGHIGSHHEQELCWRSPWRRA